MNKKIILTILSSKVLILLIIFLSYHFLPFNKLAFQFNRHYLRHQKVSLATAYSTWDAQHYLFVATKGYVLGSDSNAFFPLYPFLIAIVNYLLNNPVIAGLIVSNVISFLGLYVFYLFCLKVQKSEEIAEKSLVYLLVFPTSFFFCLIYSEALFFTLVICFFYFAYQKKYALASICAFLLPLTRGIGVTVAIPGFLIYLFLSHKKPIGKNLSKLLHSYLVFDRSLIFFVAPLAGFLAYFILMQHVTGNFMEGINYESRFFDSKSLSNIFHPWVTLGAFFDPHLALHNFTHSAIDRLLFLIFICLLPWVYKKVDRVLFCYYFLVELVPLMGSFMSYTRYFLMGFPFFMALAVCFMQPKRKIWETPYIFAAYALQIFFLVMYALNYWVA
ncbi:MAG TPA: mannosyltransferase family protein [Patescibacteria group bacterium]|nr:mannosyltransferase family protein [Patescibacteria group bacterium]